MSLDAINDIAAAEEQAKREIADAQQNAKKAVSDAEKAAASALESARAKADEEIGNLMKATEELAAKSAVELSQNTENKCAAIRAHAEQRLEAAAAAIVGKVVGG
ncbi:MAG: hypothetical protein IKR21_02630 [Oscillospiraceae bacterium]|nr:hypothetical protein [Oscillospiraceae bacterium]